MMVEGEIIKEFLKELVSRAINLLRKSLFVALGSLDEIKEIEEAAGCDDNNMKSCQTETGQYNIGT